MLPALLNPGTACLPWAGWHPISHDTCLKAQESEGSVSDLRPWISLHKQPRGAYREVMMGPAFFFITTPGAGRHSPHSREEETQRRALPGATWEVASQNHIWACLQGLLPSRGSGWRPHVAQSTCTPLFFPLLPAAPATGPSALSFPISGKGTSL